MSFRIKKTWIILLATFVVTFLYTDFNLSASASSTDKTVRKIKVGMVLNFTGPAASTYKPESEGLLDLLWWVNEKMGGWKFFNPKTGKEEVFKYDIMWEDAASSPAMGMAAYNRFRDKNPDVIFAIASGQSDALAPLSSRDHQPVVLATLTPGAAKVLPRYHLWGADGYVDFFGAALGWIAKEKPGAKVGVIAADVSFGRSFDIPQAKEYAKKLGLELLPIVYAPFPTFNDATMELKRMDRMNPDIIYVQDLSQRAATVVNDAHKLGLWKKYTWMFSNLCLPGMLMDLCDNKAIGAYGLYFIADTVSNPDVESVKLMRSIFKEKGRKGSLGYEALYQLTGCFIPIVSKMIQNALEKYGYPLTPEQIVWGFESLRDYDWGNISANPINTGKESPFFINSPYIYRIDSADSRPIIGKSKCVRLTPIAVQKKAVYE